MSQYRMQVSNMFMVNFILCPSKASTSILKKHISSCNRNEPEQSINTGQLQRCQTRRSDREIIETLRSRFGDLTTNGKPRFSVSGFTLAVCPYLGLKIRGLNIWLPCLFSFVRSVTFVLAEKSSLKLRLYEKELDS